MNLEDFTTTNAPKEGGDTFQLESGKMLDIDIDGSVMAKAGSMIAYEGDLSFTGKSSAEGGITGFIKQAATSEGTPVMEVEGTGHLYVADQDKKIQILELDADETVTVNGNDILAFESRVEYSIGMIDSLSGTSSGGLTNVYLEGPGYIAITTHGEPLVLTPPVRTDPAATVAWGGVSPGTHVNSSLSDMIGQSSDERRQLDFTGEDGFVIVQPFEEVQPGQ